MKIIKTSATKFHESVERTINRIKKAGYFVDTTDSWLQEYKIKKEKGFFKPCLVIELLNLPKITIISFKNSKNASEKKFVEEPERKTKLRLIKYI